MRAVLGAAFLRGGGEGRRDGSPPRAGSGAPAGQVKACTRSAATVARAMAESKEALK